MSAAYSSLGRTKVLYATSLVLLGAKAKFPQMKPSAFVHVCLFVPCGHLLGKGWPLGSSLWCLIVSLSLSHWYPGSGVVLDCIDS